MAATSPHFEASSALRRIRRTADLSQRELATAAGIARSTLAAAEAGARELGIGALVRAAGVAGLRLALLDADGAEVEPMSQAAVRDRGGRYFPAHLDTRYSEDGWWHGPERYTRPEPWYTFDRRRAARDAARLRDGTPEDHQLPQPGNSPEERRAARRHAALERRRAARPPAPVPAWVCDCPSGCAELEDWHGPPRHTADCPCGCDPC